MTLLLQLNKVKYELIKQDIKKIFFCLLLFPGIIVLNMTYYFIRFKNQNQMIFKIIKKKKERKDQSITVLWTILIEIMYFLYFK